MTMALPVPDTALDPGERVGGYTVARVLGEGGMGRVYEARGDDGTAVALKLIKPALVSNADFLKRFEREATAAATVDHPHVVKVLDVGVDADRRYMALELMEGGSLADRILRVGPLPLDETVRIALEVGSALDALHAAGVIHRDIKPGNILIDDDERIRITDFGLAKQRDASVLTRMGQTVGSMDYMAPEQIRGEQDLTGAADVYALGCVLWECVAGAAPFADRKGMRVMWAHLQEEPADPTAQRTDAPSSLGWAINRALCKEPSDRPPTATAFARMVQMAVGQGGLGR
jgi:serine/threonine protein kinase